MKTAVLIAQILLAVAFLMAGVMKLITPYAELQGNMPWVEDFSPLQVQIIGILEVLGALGLILPWLLKRNYRFVPLAAAGLALTMLVAVIVHVNRGEPFIPPLVLLALSAFVLYGRKGWLKGTAV